MLYGLGDIRMRRVFIEQEDAGEERKRREHRRLDALISYCESPACRHRALLGYFGERIEPCGNCDACLDPVDMVDGTTEGQKILSGVYRTGQRFGAAHIIDVLRGTMTEKVVKAGHERLPTFGAGAERKKEDWRSLIRQLVAAEFLHFDVKDFGGLAITDKGMTLLRGEESFHYRQDTMKRAPAKLRKARSGEPVPDLSADETALLGKLKELRLVLAKERGVPAYIIFSEKSLADMVRRKPQNADEFAEVNGVGKVKLERFAAPFLEIITNSAVAPVGDDERMID